MVKEYQESYLRRKWAYQEPIQLNGIKYRVGRMSYGDFFLEPGLLGSERAGFNKGTLWLKRADKQGYFNIGHDNHKDELVN